MIELMTKAFTPVLLVYLVSTMLASGLSLTPAQIFGPFRKLRLTISAVVGGYVLMPVIAVLLARLFQLDEPLRYGLVLVALAAGAESVPLLTTNGKGNVGVAVGLLVTSLLIGVFYLPFMISLFLKDVQIDRVHLLVKLGLTVALPVVIGLIVKARYDRLAGHLGKFAHKISALFMFLTAILIFVLNYDKLLLLFGSRAIGVGVIYLACGFFIGYLLGGPERETRVPMAFWVALRNATIPMLIAAQEFKDPNVLVMVSVMVMLMVVLALPTSYWLGRASGPQPKIAGTS